MIFVYLLLFMLVGTLIGLFIVTFNWKVLAVLKGATDFQMHRIGYYYCHIDSIEGALTKDKVRPIIGSVCHVTFFPCDFKWLGKLTLCYHSVDGLYYTRQGVHWRGDCPFR